MRKERRRGGEDWGKRERWEGKKRNRKRKRWLNENEGEEEEEMRERGRITKRDKERGVED